MERSACVSEGTALGCPCQHNQEDSHVPAARMMISEMPRFRVLVAVEWAG